MARNDGTAANTSTIGVKSTRANARLITRKLASAEKKMREAMAELAEAAEAVTNGEEGPEYKVTEFNDLRSATRIVAKSTAILNLSWSNYEEARIGG